MDVVALLVAIVAIVVFLWGLRPNRLRPAAGYINVGLALLVLAWIVDAVHLTGHYARIIH